MPAAANSVEPKDAWQLSQSQSSPALRSSNEQCSTLSLQSWIAALLIRVDALEKLIADPRAAHRQSSR
jgi:hypothetical protein